MLKDHPDVADCAAIGEEVAPTKIVVAAYVVPRPGSTLTADDVIAYAPPAPRLVQSAARRAPRRRPAAHAQRQGPAARAAADALGCSAVQTGDVTALLLTVGEPYAERALASIQRQTMPAAAVIAVRDVIPFHRALNQGAAQICTPFFVQVDADMILDVSCFADLAPASASARRHRHRTSARSAARARRRRQAVPHRLLRRGALRGFHLARYRLRECDRAQ